MSASGHLPAFTLAPTPWNDRVLNGRTAHLTFGDLGGWEPSRDLALRDNSLQQHLAEAGFVYVSTSIDADDLRAKAIVQHLGFDFIYQSANCFLKLTPKLVLPESDPGFAWVERSPEAGEEAALLCAETLKHGRFCEDPFLVDEGRQRNAAFIRDLHARQDVVAFLTRAGDGTLNGYSYSTIKGDIADMIIMGIRKAATPRGGGPLFWQLCLRRLRDEFGVRRARTRIPAANLGVLNLYARLGFTFVQPSYDFRLLPMRQGASAP
jgi:hypothetical protein